VEGLITGKLSPYQLVGYHRSYIWGIRIYGVLLFVLCHMILTFWPISM